MSNTTGLVLRALGYAGEWDSDPGSDKFRTLVSWVEDTKVRLHKVEDREALRDHGSPTWSKTFEAVSAATPRTFS